MSEISYAALTDVGRVREKNEDRWVADPEQGLYMVADGMGGTSAGGLAAEVVVKVLPRRLRQKLQGIHRLDDPRATDLVLSALVETSDRLRNESKDQDTLRGMGSTVALVLVRDRQALIAHMGDSRVYLLRGGRLEQLTKDHTIAQLLLDSGEIAADEVATHPSRSQLTRYVGMRDEALPEARGVELARGDRLLLCTDGLSGMLDDDRLLAILSDQLDPEDACRQLVSSANEAGGNDNVTAVVVCVSKGVT